MNPEFRRFIGDSALAIDLINIAPVDDLHRPQGIIREAQEIAAEAYGADHTLFSVQGTSSAIQTMILSACRPGDKILLPRNVHKSVLSGLILSGVMPVFMAPELDFALGIAHGVSAQTVREALQAHPDAKALLVVNPTYFGVATDLRSIVNLAHDRGIPVLVDEAHGVHFHFYDGLPPSAMQVGADMAAVSVHKLGGSLTQTSVLNLRKGLVNPQRVQTVMSSLTTTSTSYLLLASLDVARKQLATKGYAMIQQALALADHARRAINGIPGLYCFGQEMIDRDTARFGLDPSKLCISVRGLGITGLEGEKFLRQEFNIEVELSDLYNIVCIISLGHTVEDVNTLVRALEFLAGHYSNKNVTKSVRVRIPVAPVLAISPREAFFAETESLPWREAEGRIIAESVSVYPPGIPILLPGEVITQENISYIEECEVAGLPLQGTEDETGQRVKVVQKQC